MVERGRRGSELRGLQAQLLALHTLRRPTVITATHDVEQAALPADRVVVLGARPGRLGADLALADAWPRRPSTAATEAAMGAVHAALEGAVA